MKKIRLICICFLLAAALLVPAVAAHAEDETPAGVEPSPTAAAPAPASSGSSAPEAPVETAPALSEAEIQLLARVVYGEARGESFLGKVAVANVALNRLKNGRYGRTLSAILKRPHQFAVARRTNKECLEAVHFLIDNGLRILPENACYFKTSDHPWRGLVPYCRIGGHRFFTSGQPRVDMSKPFVNDQGILVWPNASLWDEKHRTQFIFDKLFAAEDAQKEAPAAAASGAVDFRDLDRLKTVFKKYEKLLGADTLLL